MEARELIEALIARGWTQQRIGERIGLTQASVSKVARGDVDDVMSRSYRHLESLHAEVMGSAKAA